MNTRKSYEIPEDEAQEQKQEQSKFTVETVKNPGLDISGELYRVYTFPGGEVVSVNGPKTLWVKESRNGHSHRIALANGNGVYIPSGWVKIEWQNKPGQPPVAW
jgi:hypothetical protein